MHARKKGLTVVCGAAAILLSLALALFSQVAGEQGERNAEFYLRLGKSFMESAQYDQALMMFEKARTLETGSDLSAERTAAHRGLADALFKKGDWRGAAAHYEAAKKLTPSIEVGDRLSEAYGRMAVRCGEEGKLAEADANIDKALALSPGNLALMRVKGEILLRKGDLDGALGRFAEIVKTAPKEIDARMRVGLINERIGNNKQAVQAYQSIVDENPHYVPAYLALGEHYERKGLLVQAEEVYRKGIENVPSEVTLHANLAWVYISGEDYTKAYKECKTALGMDAENAYAHNYMGLIFTRIKRFPEAQQEYLKALAAKPDYLGARLNLAFLYGLMGRGEDAIREYKEALAKEPDNAEAHYNLGINYKKEGRFVLAKYHLERAAKLYGYESTLGKRALDKLKQPEGEKKKQASSPQ